MVVKLTTREVELPVVETPTHSLVLDPLAAFEHAAGTPMSVLLTGHMRAIDAARCLSLMPHTVYKWYDEGAVEGYKEGKIHRYVEVGSLLSHVGSQQWTRSNIGKVWQASPKPTKKQNDDAS